ASRVVPNACGSGGNFTNTKSPASISWSVPQRSFNDGVSFPAWTPSMSISRDDGGTGQCFVSTRSYPYGGNDSNACQSGYTEVSGTRQADAGPPWTVNPSGGDGETGEYQFTRADCTACAPTRAAFRMKVECIQTP